MAFGFPCWHWVEWDDGDSVSGRRAVALGNDHRPFGAARLAYTDVMTNSGSAGFWGYAHIDDEADSGRVTRLAKKIQLEYQVLTTQKIEIFVDRDSLAWGDNWRERIDGSLQATTFYIPIITPSFIASKECRREFLSFVNAAKALGVEEYILAIRYIPVEDLNDDSSDEIKALVAATQYEDFGDLRFEDETGPLYRKAVNRLATRLKELSELVESRPAAANVHADRMGIGSAVVAVLTREDGNAPGLLDVIGDFESASTKWLETINKIGPLIDEFNGAIREGTEELNSVADKPFAQRLNALRRMAQHIEPPSKKIEEAGAEYVVKLLAIDPMVRAMIELAKATESDTPQASAAKDQFVAIQRMAATSKATSATLTEVGAMARKYSNFSRDLRPAFKAFDAGTRSIVDGQSIIDEWARLVQDAGLAEQLDEG